MKYIDVTATHQLRGEVRLPASKSISNRALIISALSGSPYRPENISDCDDTRVMVRALTQNPYEIDIMAAGTAMRFLTAYLCVTEGEHVITGTERMRHRPIQILVDALRQLGAEVDYAGEEGFPPLRIKGKKLEGGKLSLPGNVSSQYISALLMVAPTLTKGLQLELTGEVVSRPYINMTLTIMRQFGAVAEWESDHTLNVQPQAYQPVPYTIENDWSAASYWYEMMALSNDKQAEIHLPALFQNSTQGDSRVATYFEALGVQTEYTADGITLRKGGEVAEQLELNLVEQPDLAQTFVATCAAMGVPFCFTGLQSLKIKETDRIVALETECGKLGYALQCSDDCIAMHKAEHHDAQPYASLDTYEDHRMAMSLAPCCMKLGTLRINNPQVVSKSYPGYWNDLSSVGFTITEGEE